jgi:hypothetical protein
MHAQRPAAGKWLEPIDASMGCIITATTVRYLGFNGHGEIPSLANGTPQVWLHVCCWVLFFFFFLLLSGQAVPSTAVSPSPFLFSFLFLQFIFFRFSEVIVEKRDGRTKGRLPKKFS